MDNSDFFDADALFGPLSEIMGDTEYASGPGAPVLGSFLEEYGPEQLLQEEAEFTQLSSELVSLSEELNSPWEDDAWTQEILGEPEDALSVSGVGIHDQ